MTRLVIVRHGETDWNRAGRWQGHAGPGLNDLGRAQAAAAARRIARDEQPAALFSSDLERSLETAAVISAAVGIRPEVDVRLREVDVGEWSGLSRAQVAERYPTLHEAWEHGANEGYPGGETFEQLQVRCEGSLDDLIARVPEGTVVVVGHGGSIRAMVSCVLGLPAERRRLLATGRNCSISVIEAVDGERRVVSVNDEGHLPGDLN